MDFKKAEIRFSPFLMISGEVYTIDTEGKSKLGKLNLLELTINDASPSVSVSRFGLYSSLRTQYPSLLDTCSTSTGIWMSCADVIIDVQKQMAQNKNCNILSILCIWPRSSSRRLFIGSYTKSVGFCICYRPTNRGFSYCLVYVGRQRRSPTLVYASMAPA